MMVFRRIVIAVVAPAWVAASCSSTSPDALPPSGRTRTLSAAVHAEVQASSAAWDAQAFVVDVASSHFTMNLAKALPPLDVSGPQSDALVSAIAAQGVWLNAAAALGNMAPAESPKSPQRSSEPIGSAESAIFGVDDVIVIAGVVIAGWAAAKGVSKAVMIRTAPVATKIGAATPAELKVINQSLGLPPEATQQQAREAFDGLGMESRLARAKVIEQELRVAEADNTAGVDSVEAEKIQSAVANSSVECGKVAVTTTVGTQLFNGQGYGQVAKGLGATETVANTVDLAIIAVNTATDVPLQPLDFLTVHLDASIASKQTAEVTIPPPATSMTPDKAAGILASPDSKASDWDAAADTQVRSAIQALPSGGGFQTGADGTITGAVSAQIHQLTVEKATNTQKVQVRDIGSATVMISAQCRDPAVSDVDTSVSSKISYPLSDDRCGLGPQCRAYLDCCNGRTSLDANAPADWYTCQTECSKTYWNIDNNPDTVEVLEAQCGDYLNHARQSGYCTGAPDSGAPNDPDAGTPDAGGTTCADGRYAVLVEANRLDCADGSGLVKDNATGLVWAGNSYQAANGALTPQAKASAYCGGKGMRLPTQDEALGIAGNNQDSCAWWCGWGTRTSTSAGSGQVWYVHYSGTSEPWPADDFGIVVALCVQ